MGTEEFAIKTQARSPPSFRSNRLPNRPLTQPPRYFSRPFGPNLLCSHRHRKAISYSLFLIIPNRPSPLLDVALSRPVRPRASIQNREFRREQSAE
jgi:hypothetical protein